MHLVFSHGKESGPWGSKIKALATEAENSGLTFESLNYTDLPDPDQRAQRLAEHIEKEDKGIMHQWRAPVRGVLLQTGGSGPRHASQECVDRCAS